MSSVKAVEDAFKLAVDRALCQVSRGRRDTTTAQQINRAMEQLARLRKLDEQPDYRDPGVALFYSQWYLPQQINTTYSATAAVLRRRPMSSLGTKKLQLVDFGAGTGAMAIGLSLAIATHGSPEHWPARIVVHQIDHPAMLTLGDDI